MISQLRAWSAATLVAAVTAVWALPAAAGTVEVRFVSPEKFSDIGWPAREREEHLKTLAAHFEALADRLPAGQTLHIDVLDVDLAGETGRYPRTELRMLRSSADWPRMTLRYELRGAPGAVQAGEQRLSEMSFRPSVPGPVRYQGSLGYEKRMIDRWFDETFPQP